ncbi:putative RNA-directed DNA polymerase from transposon X-element [Trichonephila clavipes]|nr:putative RNA-directed DNA polymerase from transposon X-element [Trichonephila clavipes]
METGFSKFFRSSLRDAEIILPAGQRIISEINILVENSQGSSQIPKSNPQLLNAEIKKKIARHENIKSMSFTRNGKIRFSTLDPVCAAQILSLEKISNVSVKTNILWEGITSRFLIFEIPLDISLNEIAKELQKTNNFEIIEIRRFIKTGSQQQFSPVLITILGTTLPETVKLWFINHRIQNFIDKPRQCTTCFSFLHSTRFCQKTAICINCGDPHSGQCSNNSRCINCKGDHPANSLNCPEYIKEKKILELKCEQHLTLGEARRRFRDNKRTSYSAVIQTNTVNLDMQDYLEKKLENMLTSFQAILEKQTTLIMEAFQKTMESVLTQLSKIFEMGNRVTPHCGKKKKLLVLNPQSVKYALLVKATHPITWTGDNYGITDTDQKLNILQLNNRFITHPQLQADLFADYFASKNAYHEPLPLDFLYDKNNLLNKPFHILELHSAIKNSKNTTPGADHVTAIFFKNLDQGQRDVILRYFQKLFDNAIVPDSWKHAILLPIPKPCKDKTKISSYRPIALTSVFSKTFERILANRISYYLTKERKLHPQHYGFVPFKDSRSATYLVHKAIMNAKLQKIFCRNKFRH